MAADCDSQSSAEPTPTKSAEPSSVPAKQGWLPVLSIALWMLCGYAMVIFNKYIISSWNFHFPFFLTCWHCLVSTILTQFLHRTTNYLPGVSLGKVGWRAYLTTVVPVSLFFAIGICLANMAYQYISVAYIQMIKAVNPVPLLLLYIAFGMEKPSFVLIVAVCIISFGVYISSMGELRFSWLGFAVQMGSVIADCLRIINTDGLLKDAGLDPLSLLYYTAPLAATFVGAAFFLFEYATFPWASLQGELAWLLLGNGMIAFSVNFSTVFAISCTSGLVMSVCGPFKDSLVIFSSAAMFGAPITILQVMGFAIEIGGMALYRAAKMYPDHLHSMLHTSLPDWTWKWCRQEAAYNRLPTSSDSSGP